jgi:hypothetical protein
MTNETAPDPPSHFRIACTIAEIPVNLYVQNMPPDVRARNPFVVAGVEHNPELPPGIVLPPGAEDGVRIEMNPVYASELEEALAELPISDRQRGVLRWHVEQHGSILTITRLPYVRVILYDLNGGACAFARVDDETVGEAN